MNAAPPVIRPAMAAHLSLLDNLDDADFSDTDSEPLPKVGQHATREERRRAIIDRTQAATALSAGKIERASMKHTARERGDTAENQIRSIRQNINRPLNPNIGNHPTDQYTGQREQDLLEGLNEHINSEFRNALAPAQAEQDRSRVESLRNLRPRTFNLVQSDLDRIRDQLTDLTLDEPVTAEAISVGERIGRIDESIQQAETIRLLNVENSALASQIHELTLQLNSTRTESNRVQQLQMENAYLKNSRQKRPEAKPEHVAAMNRSKRILRSDLYDRYLTRMDKYDTTGSFNIHTAIQASDEAVYLQNLAHDVIQNSRDPKLCVEAGWVLGKAQTIQEFTALGVRAARASARSAGYQESHTGGHSSGGGGMTTGGGGWGDGGGGDGG